MRCLLEKWNEVLGWNALDLERGVGRCLSLFLFVSSL